MDLESDIFTKVLGPLAAFNNSPQTTSRDNSSAKEDDKEDGCGWLTSRLNPQSRINSLAHHKTPTWLLDGFDLDGRRCFAVPLFALDAPPLRIDVILPPIENYPDRLRDDLNPAEAIYSQRKKRKGGVAELDVARYLLRVLQSWSEKIPDFETTYNRLPFGSTIKVASVAAHVENAEVLICPDYAVEQRMLSAEQLQRMWGVKAGLWPPTIDLEKLRLKRQVHEAISLVTLQPAGEVQDAGTREYLYVFKSLVRDQRYMYNELRMLLELGGEANVVPKPLYLVTKRGRFGGRRGICGFVAEFMPSGSLKDRLQRDGSATSQTQRLRWARQVTEALIHVNNHPFGFYPDLKPDNILLRATAESCDLQDAVLLDLEQRGGWFSWSPPEVGYLEYLEILASSLGSDGNHAEIAAELAAQLREYMPGWAPSSQQDRYRNSEGGFDKVWLALLRRRRDEGSAELEKAQVFMLGKLLWCIFEGQPLIRCGIDHEILQDSQPCSLFRDSPRSPMAFPEFKRAAPSLRRLICRCTAGAPEWEEVRTRRYEDGVFLCGGKLVPGIRHSKEHPRDVAKAWWSREVDRAKGFLEELVGRREGVSPSSLIAQAEGRPTLAEVLDELISLEARGEDG